MQTYTLDNELVVAEVSPELGCELRVFRKKYEDNIFLETPFSDEVLEKCDCSATNEQHFLSHYHGGMQTMFPNAGYESSFAGLNYGYHGDVWSRTWNILEITDSTLSAEIFLPEANVQIKRTIKLEEFTLNITDLISNKNDFDFIFQYGYHPAFASSFIPSEGRFVINAKSIEIVRNTLDFAPFTIDESSDEIIFSSIFSKKFSFLAYVSNFLTPQVKLEDASGNCLAKIEFDDRQLPHAWIWIESDFIDASPWNSKVKTFAFEPCSSKTNQGIATAVRNNLGFLKLAPKQSLKTFFKIELNSGGLK